MKTHNERVDEQRFGRTRGRVPHRHARQPLVEGPAVAAHGARHAAHAARSSASIPSSACSAPSRGSAARRSWSATGSRSTHLFAYAKTAQRRAPAGVARVQQARRHQRRRRHLARDVPRAARRLRERLRQHAGVRARQSEPVCARPRIARISANARLDYSGAPQANHSPSSSPLGFWYGAAIGHVCVDGTSGQPRQNGRSRLYWRGSEPGCSA